MIVLRTTIFAHEAMPPMTTVVRDVDLRVSVEEAMRIGAEPIDDQLPLVIYDAFEVTGKTSVEAATAAALERQDRQAEQHMATAYYWLVRDVLPMLRKDGLVYAPGPASPLTRERIVQVLERTAQHPAYEGQTVVLKTDTGADVKMVDGKVQP